MDAIMTQALEIVKAQASTRAMTAEEITSMLRALTASISGISSTAPATEGTSEFSLEDAKKSIREKSVTCLECGGTFKVLTKRHLASHNLTPKEYCEKWGLKKGTPLVSKSLARDRRKKMQDMKLWEKRGVKPGAKESNFPAREEIQ